MKQSKIVGLTGGISTGKSTVSKYLIKKGFEVIDADKIAKRALDKESFSYNEIVKYFGQEILDENKNIDRKKMGSIIFSNKEKRNKLNEIVHPFVFESIKQRILESKNEIIFLDIPLLFETYNSYKKYNILFDYIIVVETSLDIQLERLINRDNISEELARQKINSQMSIKDKIERADIIINNDGTIECLYKRTDEVLIQLT